MKSPPLLAALFLLIAPVTMFASEVVKSVQPEIDGHFVAGAVTLVANHDRVLDVGVAGFADLAARRRMRPDSLFWIASMTKPITATAVMMLVEEGRISLDDPVSKYLPNFAGLKVAEQAQGQEVLRPALHPITIRNLLTHTSGLTPRSPLEIPHVDRLSLADNVTSYPMLPLRFEPGSRFEYSNAGMNTAGRIVELVSGLSFSDFLQRRLFGPLGMKDATFWPGAEQLTRLVKSYRLAAGGTGLDEIRIESLSYPLSDRRRGCCPAGGLFATADDMSRFCRLILSGGAFEGRRYLAAASVRMMTADQTRDLFTLGNVDFGYGFGWQIFRKDHPASAATAGCFQHGGSYNTLMRIDPGHDRIGILMVSNQHLPLDVQNRLWSAFFTAANATSDRPAVRP